MFLILRTFWYHYVLNFKNIKLQYPFFKTTIDTIYVLKRLCSYFFQLNTLYVLKKLCSYKKECIPRAYSEVCHTKLILSTMTFVHNGFCPPRILSTMTIICFRPLQNINSIFLKTVGDTNIKVANIFEENCIWDQVVWS